MNQHESLPREEDAPRWLLVSLVVLLLIGSGAGLYWLATSERADQVFGKPATLGHERVITRVEQILDEPAKLNLIGRDVQIRSVAVQNSVGEYTFWIGPDEANRTPVVLVGEMGGSPAREATPVRDGSVVTIFGTVRATSSGRVFEEDPRLTEEQRAALRSTEVYIAAHTALVESEPTRTTAEEALPAVDDQVATRIGRALDERARVDFAGRQVTIRGAGVQSVVGDYTFWIGRDENNRIPVVLVGEMTGRQPHGETIVRNGNVVTIFGVVRATGQGRVFEQDSLLDDEQRSQLAATDTYIAASQVLVHDQ